MELEKSGIIDIRRGTRLRPGTELGLWCLASEAATLAVRRNGEKTMACNEFGILHSLSQLRFGRAVSPEAGVQEVKAWGADVVLGWVKEHEQAGNLDMLEAYLDNEGVSLCEAFGPEIQREVDCLRQKLTAGRAREGDLGSSLNLDHPRARESMEIRQQVEDLHSRMQAANAFRAP